ncbi:hypothetical protein Lfu02_13290 [Longispora fulva]|uniref:Uncharacterized protein n=1 Tax=Longispora fulva TaxID=619741 RepID=A0A8J7KIV9_9ACTN|nr:hypothetical protein [Longispora fulva]MBG6134811.1 hypothetical protein [Longispora fulva]GIG56957.1 hypothetical protein Lfu02_13290 [Longispora fulva]
MNQPLPGAGTAAPEPADLDPRVTRHLAERVAAFESEIEAVAPAGPRVGDVTARLAARTDLSPAVRLLLRHPPIVQGLLRDQSAALPKEQVLEAVLAGLRSHAAELEKDVCEDFLADAALPGHRAEVVSLARAEHLDVRPGQHQHQILAWWLRAKITSRSLPKLLNAMGKVYLPAEEYTTGQLERAAHQLDAGASLASVLSGLRSAHRLRPSDGDEPCPQLPPLGPVTGPVPVLETGAGDARAAGAVLQMEAFGDGLGMFEGARSLVRRWEAGELRFADEKVNALLYCHWQRGERLDAPARATLYGSVRSAGDFPELWNDLIRSVGRYLDHEDREAYDGDVGDSVALSAVLAASLRIRARLTTAVGGLADWRARELYRQYTEATDLLSHPDVVAALAPGGDRYQVADALARLDDRATGDVWGGYTRAYAVSTVLDELVDLAPGDMSGEQLRPLIRAAALLRRV